jgi:hypothetical protein
MNFRKGNSQLQERTRRLPCPRFQRLSPSCMNVLAPVCIKSAFITSIRLVMGGYSGSARHAIMVCTDRTCNCGNPSLL